MHLAISDVALGRKIEDILKSEGLTHDQFAKKYIKLPEDEVEKIRREFDVFKNEYIKTVNGFSDRKSAGILLDNFFTLCIQVSKGKLDLQKVAAGMEDICDKCKK